jgi:hypothetical protein
MTCLTEHVKIRGMQFSELVGSQIFIVIPRIHATDYQEVKLIGVETGGLWIESQEFTNVFLQLFGVPAAQKTPVVFFPYHEIAYVVTSLEQLALDEKAHGL